MAVLLKAICKLYTISIKVQAQLIIEIENLILNVIWKHKQFNELYFLPHRYMLIHVYSSIPNSQNMEKGRHSSTDEYIIKIVWYLYKVKFYSAVKNEIMKFANKQMELNNINLSKVAQILKDKHYILTHMCILAMNLQMLFMCLIWSICGSEKEKWAIGRVGMKNIRGGS